MAELLRVVIRGPSCPAEHEVSGSRDHSRLLCSLKPGHSGPLHFDAFDRIWWSADE